MVSEERVTNKWCEETFCSDKKVLYLDGVWVTKVYTSVKIGQAVHLRYVHFIYVDDLNFKVF